MDLTKFNTKTDNVIIIINLDAQNEQRMSHLHPQTIGKPNSISVWVNIFHILNMLLMWNIKRLKKCNILHNNKNIILFTYVLYIF